MSRVLTGSQLDRAASCPASAVLPQGPDTPGDAAIRGQAVHAKLEHRDQELEDALQEHGVSLDDLWPEGGVHEALVWYDPVTRQGGYKKREGEARDYTAFPEGVLVGTIDYLNPTLGMVDDLKTGVPPAPTSLQLGLASVGLADGAGLGSVTASVTKASLAPDDGGGLRLRSAPERRSVHHAEAAQIKDSLDRLYADHLLNRVRVDRGVAPAYNPSPKNCRWCRAVCDRRV